MKTIAKLLRVKLLTGVLLVATVLNVQAGDQADTTTRTKGATPPSNTDTSAKNRPPQQKKEENQKPAAPNQAAMESQVLKVFTLRMDTTNQIKSNTAYANELIIVEISNPQILLTSRPTDTTKLFLYADGLPFKRLYSDYFLNYTKAQMLKDNYKLGKTIQIPFILRRNQDTKVAWDYIYRISKIFQNRITVHISLGWEGMAPIQKAENANDEVTIVYFTYWYSFLILGVYCFIVGFFIYRGLTTDLLRDKDARGTGAYSLSQTQLAYWTIIIVGGFMYSLVLTDLPESLNSSVLLLLGINLTATGAASYIDYSNKQVPGALQKPHTGFFKDILSDGLSYSIPRIQVAIWNLVLGIYFIYFTITNKTMPVFPNELLFLMGFSSITYVAVKGTEK